jgi:hypothetical protein
MLVEWTLAIICRLRLGVRKALRERQAASGNKS